MTDMKADARLAVLVLATEQMYDAQGPGTLQPVVDPRISSDWALHGYITGTDALLRELGRWALGDRQVFYGLVVESKASPGTLAAVIRGTASGVEWLEDGEGLPTVDQRYAGLVESGFVGIADTLVFHSPGAQEDAPIDLGEALDRVVQGGSLMVTGHSLGAALATYTAYDAAQHGLAGHVALRVFASPHPGNANFCTAASDLIPDHVHYRNADDLVPRVPIAFGYRHLVNTVTLEPSTTELLIKSNPGCSHHLLSYLALMDDEAFKAAASPQNQPYLPCIVRK